MDYCFNKCIPKSEEGKIIIRPNSKTFVTGLAESYDETYPKQLEKYITPDEWSGIISRINEALFYYWPCFMCLSFGYCFSCCTLGLSFCFAGIQISKAKRQLQIVIIQVNKEFAGRFVKFRLVEKCCTSWIAVEIENDFRAETDNSQL